MATPPRDSTTHSVPPHASGTATYTHPTDSKPRKSSGAAIGIVVLLVVLALLAYMLWPTMTDEATPEVVVPGPAAMEVEPVAPAVEVPASEAAVAPPAVPDLPAAEEGGTQTITVEVVDPDEAGAAPASREGVDTLVVPLENPAPSN